MSDSAIAFLFHGPGLRLLRGYRMPTMLFVVNVVAITLTFASAGYAYFALQKLWLAVTLWLGGHFGWSFFLAWYVAQRR